MLMSIGKGKFAPVAPGPVIVAYAAGAPVVSPVPNNEEAAVQTKPEVKVLVGGTPGFTISSKGALSTATPIQGQLSGAPLGDCAHLKGSAKVFLSGVPGMIMNGTGMANKVNTSSTMAVMGEAKVIVAA